MTVDQIVERDDGPLWPQRQDSHVFFNQYDGPKPELYGRYIDDCIGAISSSREELDQFITSVNSFHPALKYTWEISETSLAFLDIKVSIRGNALCTSVHYKPTDSHSYLLYSSSHPSHVKNSIPYSQFLRLRRLCSDDSDFSSKSEEMCQFFENLPKNLYLIVAFISILTYRMVSAVHRVRVFTKLLKPVYATSHNLGYLTGNCIWFDQTCLYRLNCHRKRFEKLTFRALTPLSERGTYCGVGETKNRAWPNSSSKFLHPTFLIDWHVLHRPIKFPSIRPIHAWTANTRYFALTRVSFRGRNYKRIRKLPLPLIEKNTFKAWEMLLICTFSTTILLQKKKKR